MQFLGWKIYSEHLKVSIIQNAGIRILKHRSSKERLEKANIDHDKKLID